MALSDIKTYPKNEKPKINPRQINGSYKIRQIIIKLMEYTYIRKYPYTKSKQSNKNRVQEIDLANKGNQKLYLPVKNKTN